MLINVFDTEIQKQNLLDLFSDTEEIENSLSINRRAYRIFATKYSIKVDALLKCLNSYQRSLLIECYTYSEKLFKNFYYHLLNKGSNKNEHIDIYLNSKIPSDKFSPNVKFAVIENSIKNELIKDFMFPIEKNKIEIRQYDELIRSRHAYAHSGEYLYDYTTTSNVIKVLDYITFSFVTIIEKSENYWITYAKQYSELYDLTCKIKKNSKNKIDNQLKEEIKKIRDLSVKFTKKYYVLQKNVDILSPINDRVAKVSKIRLYNYQSALKTIEDLQKMMST